MAVATRVPLIDLKKQYHELHPEILAAWQKLLDQGAFILGAEVEAFEREMAHLCQSQHAIGVTSGTDALWLAIKALDLKPGSQILTSPFTFFATISATVNAGMVPVFADVEPSGFNLDPNLVEEALRQDKDRKIGAIIVVHLFGQMAEMDKLCDIARRYEVPIIEDAAQAIGAHYAGKQAGNFGEVGCFSFFPTKNLGALGDAGLCTVNSDSLNSRILNLRNHGSDVRYYHDRIGGNFRIDALQTAALRLFIKRFPQWIRERQAAATFYDAALSRYERQMKTPVRLPNRDHTYHQYTLRVLGLQRDSLKDFLSEKGVASAVYYPVPCHLQKALADCGYRKGDFPVTEQLAQEVLSLPMNPTLSQGDLGYVVDCVGEWVSSHS